MEGDVSFEVNRCSICGAAPIRVLETVLGNVELSEEEEDGSFSYAGETDVCWDSQETVIDLYGKATLSDYRGHIWLSRITHSHDSPQAKLCEEQAKVLGLVFNACNALEAIRKRLNKPNALEDEDLRGALGEVEGLLSTARTDLLTHIMGADEENLCEIACCKKKPLECSRCSARYCDSHLAAHEIDHDTQEHK